jgi:hypothetical protein
LSLTILFLLVLLHGLIRIFISVIAFVTSLKIFLITFQKTEWE